MAQLPEIDRELLMRALSRPNVGQTIQAGVGGFKTGVDIGTALSNQKMKRQKEEMELMKQIEEATAKQNLVQEATTPIPTTRTLRELTEMRVPKMREVPADLMDASKGSTYVPDEEAERNVQNILSLPKDKLEQPETKTALDISYPEAAFRGGRTVPLTKEELAKEKVSKEEKVKGLAIKVAPEKYAENLLSSQKLTNATRPMPLPLELPNGTQVLGQYDPTAPENERYKLQDGTPAPLGTTRSYKYDIRPDAAGNFVILSGASGQIVDRISSGATGTPLSQYGTVTSVNNKLVPTVDREDIVKRVATIKTDPSISNAKQLLPVFNNVKDYVNSDNKVATDRLGGLVQKLVALDSGNLAAWEQRMPGSADVITRIKALYELKANGRLEGSNKKSLLELLEIARTNLADNVRASAGMTIDSLVNTYPYMSKKALYDMSGLTGFEEYVSGGKKSLESLADKYFGGGR